MKGKKQEDVQVGFGDLVLVASNLAASFSSETRAACTASIKTSVPIEEIETKPPP